MQSWLIIGQSNALSPMFSGSSGADQRDNIYALYDGTLTKAQGDTSGTVSSFVGQWPLRLASLFDDEIVITNCGVSGVHIDYFLNETNYAAVLARATSLSGYEPKHIFWYQGEQDAYEGTTQPEYVAKLQGLIDDLQSDYGCGITIIQIGYGCPASNDAIDVIRSAQKQVAIANGLRLIDVSGISKYTDNCHYDYSGYCQIAERIYKRIVNGEIE